MSPDRHSNYASISDVGLVRSHNEDTVLAEPPLFVVADGLGGHEAGEVASSVAVQTLLDHAPRHADSRALARAVRSANKAVLKAAKEGLGRQGMGTTMTAALIEGTHIAIAHVGDSRAYLFDGATLERITEDHSMVADMVRRGTLTEEESRRHPNRSVITRALGTDADMDADAYDIEASPGNLLILASDGLTGMLEDTAIAEIVRRNADLGAASRELVAAANDAGGHDNVSVVIAEVTGTTAVPARSRSRGWLSVLLWLIAFSVLVGGIALATYRYASSRAYIIAEDGVVKVYRGVPGSFAGASLSWLETETTLTVDALPPVTAARLREGVTVENLQEAQRAVDEYLRSAETTARP